MLRGGNNGPADGKDIFAGDDDDQSDIQLDRGSIYSAANGNMDNNNHLK